MPDEEKPGMGDTASGTLVVERPKGEEPRKPTLDEALEELERTRVALKAANKDAETKRRRLDEFEKADADRQAASLSETEKLKKQAEDAKLQADKAVAKANERVIRAEVIAAASRLDFEDPEDVYALLRGKGKLDDLGDPDSSETSKAIKDMLEELAKSKKHLLRAGTKGPQLGPTNPGAGAGPAETKEQKRDRLLGRGTDVWDPDVMRQHGGGVVFADQESKPGKE